MSRAMKNSGIPWIGEIPEGWNVSMLSSYFKQRKHKNQGLQETNLLSLSYGNIIRKSIDTNEGLLPESFETYNIIEKNDIVFRLTDLQNDKKSLRTGLCTERGIITSAYITLKPDQPLNSPYFHYLLHIYDICKVFYGLGDGVRQGMNYDDLRKLLIIVPPLSEQEAIAEFLDRKCGEVDEMVSLQEQVIEELKAYKQSIITEAVTKGLRPDVPMKPSGIDWIGEIPEHWETIRLRFLCTIQTGDSDTQDAVQDGQYPFYVRSPKIERSNRFTFDGEGILMAGDGAGAGRVFHHAFGKYAVHQRVYRLANFGKINTDFLFYFISSLFCKLMDRGSAQSTVPSVRLPMLTNFVVCIPPLSEQREIADYLDRKCADIDALIALKQQKIEDLRAYKKSLIYEYVTGKKQVLP